MDDVDSVWFLTIVYGCGHVSFTSIMAVNNNDAVTLAMTEITNVSQYNPESIHCDVMEDDQLLSVDAYYFVGVDVKASLIKA